MKKKHARQSGVSLAEVLISIVIIAIILIGALMFQKKKWLDYGRTKNIDKAIQAIEGTIENMRTSISLNAANFPPHDTTIAQGSITLTRTVSAAYDNRSPASAINNARRIDIKAKWYINAISDSIVPKLCTIGA